ncbi:S8 family serine peptidase [Streptomyces sp. MI02-7b]|uniref:S8 family serine peptidase n=1 Tax=Streptomyces sp. MI02-7b TaxID=462941 RepID=UPI0029B588B2|nr:S8 family serine peptidase [Streptomyces sp. MI02-7b]MDX3072856.1 S8 family serine peptidase [Streptomyces sp. MI02-7b]
MRPLFRGRSGLQMIAGAAGVAAVLAAIPPASASDHATASTPTPTHRIATATAIVKEDSGGSPSRTVTLLTGDRVTLTPGGSGPAALTVEGPDGGRADARITTRGGDTYVYPAAAERYVAAGLLDTDLFNVTRLIADGYDDARSQGLPVILTYASDARRRLAVPSLPEGATGARALTSIGGTAVTERHDRAADFWADLTRQAPARSAARTATTGGTARAAAAGTALTGDVRKVWLDGKVEADLADSVAQIGAPEVWADGDTGQGVDVAVLDTGYDTGHPDLDGVVTSSRSFVPGEDVTDHHGHGTHVASTIAGNGAASGGKEKGVAPGVRLHVGKVLNNAGSGTDSWIISGMEWAARDAKARVVSLSLGSDRPSDGTDPMSQAVNELSAETGALFTIAAGNAGPGEATVAAPGAADAALTVGAVDSADTVADFSSRGPRFRDDALKPEVTAPGVDILAARSQYATFGSGPYATLSGTSMATPHVAGVAALVAARHPDWSGATIKNALVSTAEPTPATPADAGGNGRVDAVAATGSALVATGVADAGIHSLGGAPGETATRTVEWTNPGDSPVTLTARVDAPDAPEGLFVLTDRRLTVPAHGTASTTVTTVLDRAPAGGRWTGHVEATVDGEVVTRTLLAVSTREEMHHLRVHVTDRAGDPVSDLVMYQRKGDEYAQAAYSDLDGTLDAVVPSGTYTVWTWIAVRGTHGESSFGRALMARTGVEMRGADTDAALDGTKLRRTEVVTPRTSTDSDIRMDFSQSFKDGTPAVTDTVTVGDGFDSVWALPVAKPAGGDLAYTVRWRMQQPLLALTSGSQEFDDLWLQPGSGRPAEGTRTLPAVFAGDGTAAEYAAAGAKGKVAVVRYAQPADDDDDDERSATTDATDDQYTAAQKAGVALLVVVNDLGGRLREPVRRTDLVIAGISHTEGETLIGRIQDSRSGSVPMRVAGHAETDYLYDLVHTWHGGIPATQRYAPAEHRLARVDVGFRAEPGTEVDEFRYDIQPYLGMKVGGQRLSTAGAERTDWVTPAGEATWMEEASNGIRSIQFSGQVGYPAGRTTDVQWFGPVEHPRINESQQLPQRSGDWLEVTVPGWGDGGPGHVGVVGPGTTSEVNALYRDGTLVTRTDGPWLGTDVPGGSARYRLVTSTERTEGYPYSTATRTEWAFSSATPHGDAAQTLPLLQLDYGIATRADGTARRDAELVVTPSQLPGVSRAPLRTDSVEVSYDDGRTWRRTAQRAAGSGAARVRLDGPRGAAFLSLRVRASDTRGNTVTQTVVRATGLG